MTDGLENTAPFVASVDASLTGTTVHAIGFGDEASLNGALLTELATAHGGLYTRADGGLSLEKFYSNAFGNIFEFGFLLDPEFDLPANQPSGTPVKFTVCSEDALTAIVGWDNTGASLDVVLTTPGGATITSATAALVFAAGRTWAFIRISAAYRGRADGRLDCQRGPTWRRRRVSASRTGVALFLERHPHRRPADEPLPRPAGPILHRGHHQSYDDGARERRWLARWHGRDNNGHATERQRRECARECRT